MMTREEHDKKVKEISIRMNQISRLMEAHKIPGDDITVYALIHIGVLAAYDRIGLPLFLMQVCGIWDKADKVKVEDLAQTIRAKVKSRAEAVLQSWQPDATH